MQISSEENIKQQQNEFVNHEKILTFSKIVVFSEPRRIRLRKLYEIGGA